MPSGEIHYASNAPAVRFKTSAAPSDARRVRHWLAVSRLERQSALAASAGGQARNLRQPAYTPPKRLKPIYDGSIQLVQVSTKETLNPKPPDVPEGLKVIIKELASKLFKYMSVGWFSSDQYVLTRKVYDVASGSYDWYSKQGDVEKALITHTASRIAPTAFGLKDTLTAVSRTKKFNLAVDGVSRYFSASTKDTKVQLIKGIAAYAIGGPVGGTIGSFLF